MKRRVGIFFPKLQVSLTPLPEKSNQMKKKLLLEEDLHLRDEFLKPESDFVTFLGAFLKPGVPVTFENRSNIHSTPVFVF